MTQICKIDVGGGWCGSAAVKRIVLPGRTAETPVCQQGNRSIFDDVDK
jgi:hypothetical protein